MQFSPYYRIIPQADTAVLFIHGIVGTPAHFRDLIPLVPEKWSVYNILLDGHGGEVEDFAHTSMLKWKKQVHGTVEEILFTHSRIFLVGHSMGTLFCIQESLNFSDRVFGLFLLNVPLYPKLSLSSISNSLDAIRGKAMPGSPAEMLLSDCGVHLSPQLYKYVAWIPRYWELILECGRIRSLMGKISCPCICIHSAKDELVSRRSYEYLRCFNQFRTLELANSGHFGYMNADLSRIQNEFLNILQS